jgi:hemerythrin-like metal-binding protein
MAQAPHRWLEHRRIGTRIAIALILPLLGLALFAATLVIERGETAGEMTRMRALTALAPALGDLVHALQRERGMSVGFVNSKGAQFADPLAAQRPATDAARSALEAALAGFHDAQDDAELAKRIAAAKDALGKLGETRSAVTGLAMPAMDVATYYTGTIAQLIGILERMPRLTSNADLLNRISALVALMQVKDTVGIERAIGSGGFAAGKFEPAAYQRLLRSIAMQDAYLHTYFTHAVAADRALLQQTLDADELKPVETMRRVAIDSPTSGSLGGITAPQWFDAVTLKIDQLRKVEAALVQELDGAADGLQTEANRTFYTLLAATLAILAVTVLFVGYVVRGITRPIQAMTGVMGALSRGDLAVEIAGAHRGDEIGEMAQSVAVFRDHMATAERLAAEQKAAQAAKEHSQSEINASIKDFEVAVMSILAGLAHAESVMSRASTAVDSGARETKEQSVSVATAAEESTANIASVASATEELAASIQEITRQVAHAAAIAGQAARMTADSEGKINALSTTVGQIGAVVSLIKDIAEQTNLLALNATIEAARAGDAGRGFAVVASEVKSLATQTAKATEDIARQIGEVQASTGDTVTAIREISGVIRQVNEVSASISAAVEEQGAATQEIARNVEQASHGSAMVTENIHKVQHAAENSASLAGEIGTASGGLSRQTEVLRGNVGAFLERVRRAGGDAGDTLIAWDDKVIIDEPAIDGEHRKLFQTINDLYREIRQGHARGAVDAAFASMLDYTRTHFGHEQALMEKRGFAEATEHRQAHDDMMARMVELHGQYQAGRATAGEDLLNFLASWWMNHVATFDTRLAGFMRQNGIRAVA